MAECGGYGTPGASRLLTYHLKAGEDGLHCDSVMLCELVDGEIQSISLRVAASSMEPVADSSEA